MTDIDPKDEATSFADEARRYRVLVESMNEGFGVINRDREFTFVNRQFAAMLGMTQEETIGMDMASFLDEENTRYWEQRLRHRFDGDSSIYELRWTRRDGSELETIISGAPLKNDNGEVVGACAVIRDVTRERAIRQALRSAEAATEKSELTFRRTFEAIPGPAYIWERDADGRIVLSMVNKRITRSTRGRIKDYIGRTVETIFDEAPEILEAIRETMVTGEPDSFEMRWSLHSGRPGWFLFDFVRLTDSVLLMVTTDLTERKRAEELVRHNEALFRATVESTVDGVIVISREGDVIHHNRRFADMMKINGSALQATEEVINRDIAEDLETPAFYIATQEKIKGSDEDSFDMLFFRDGRVFERTSSPLLLDGKKMGRVWNYRDVTEREKIEDALQESETKYRQLVEQSFQGIIIVKADPLRILFANEIMAEMLGQSVQEVLNLRPEEIRALVHQDDMRTAVSRMNDLLSGGQPRNEPLTLRVTRSDGKARVLDVFARPIEYEGAPCLQVVLTDVTERTIARKQIQSEKERAMLYLDLLSHDFRNMLQVVVGSVAILEERNADPLSRSGIRNIVESVERCQSLISKVKSTEPLVPESLEPVRIYEIMAEIVNRLRTLNSDTEIRLKADDRGAVVLADASLRHLLNNILENAISHNDKAEKRVWVSLLSGDSGYWIHVSDNGPGIADRMKEALFDISRRFGGIGLHQSRQIVEKLGGRIEVRDRVPGEYSMGAEFALWLPRIDTFPLDIT
jgi:PAS domain S-box-containing protein